MSRKIKIGALVGLAVLFAAIGAFGLRTGDKAHADVVPGSVWIIPQHSIPQAVAGTIGVANYSCASTAAVGGINISSASSWQVSVENGQLNPIPGIPASSFNPVSGIITNLFGTGIVVKPPQPLGAIDAFGNVVASRATLEIPPGGSIFICVNPTRSTFPAPLTPPAGVPFAQGCANNPDGILNSTIPSTTLSVGAGTPTPVPGIGPCTGDGDGDVTFDSRNIGGFSQLSCDNRDGDATAGEWPSDACVGVDFNANDAHAAVPDAFNDVTLVIATYTCTRNPAFGGIAFPLTVEQDRGAVTFNVICVGSATPSSVSISVSPSTVEIVPARSNTSNALISVTVLDSLGNPVPGVEVEIQTNRCAVSAGASLTTARLTSLPIGVGFDDETRTAAALLIGALNTANPASFGLWEAFALFHFPSAAGVVGSTRTIAVTQNANFSVATGLPGSAIAAAILGCSPTEAPAAAPGTGTVTAIVPVAGAPDIIVTKDFTVIGPPASITVSGSPSSLRCGEKATVTATVKDIAGQNVSDHTRVEMVTNLGGVLAGTGAVASSAGPVVPVSSTVADTFGGVATAFLITSDAHEGPYEVVATSGGTTPEDAFGSALIFNPVGTVSGVGTATTALGQIVNGSLGFPSGGLSVFPSIDLSAAATTILGGVFSTPPVSAQTTVSCSIPAAALPIVAAPSISAPRTGQGITPPNTGDAGLADASGASWTLYIIGGVALTVVGLASLKFARR